MLCRLHFSPEILKNLGKTTLNISCLIPVDFSVKNKLSAEISCMFKDFSHNFWDHENIIKNEKEQFMLLSVSIQRDICMLEKDKNFVV